MSLLGDITSFREITTNSFNYRETEDLGQFIDAAGEEWYAEIFEKIILLAHTLGSTELSNLQLGGTSVENLVLNAQVIEAHLPHRLIVQVLSENRVILQTDLIINMEVRMANINFHTNAEDIDLLNAAKLMALMEIIEKHSEQLTDFKSPPHNITATHKALKIFEENSADAGWNSVDLYPEEISDGSIRTDVQSYIPEDDVFIHRLEGYAIKAESPSLLEQKLLNMGDMSTPFEEILKVYPSQPVANDSVIFEVSSKGTIGNLVYTVNPANNAVIGIFYPLLNLEDQTNYLPGFAKEMVIFYAAEAFKQLRDRISSTQES